MTNWNVRKHWDDESRKQLHESVQDTQVLEQLEAAYKDSMNAIETKEAELQGVYSKITPLLTQVSEISGVSQEHLLIITRRIAVTSRDLEWYQVLSMVYAFYRIKVSIETERDKG